MGTIKDRNSMDQAEDIKKRGQEYTEELYKKGHHDSDNSDVITHLEPDILECEVKWALGRPPHTHTKRERKEIDTRVAWW